MRGVTIARRLTALAGWSAGLCDAIIERGLTSGRIGAVTGHIVIGTAIDRKRVNDTLLGASWKALVREGIGKTRFGARSDRRRRDVGVLMIRGQDTGITHHDCDTLDALEGDSRSVAVVNESVRIDCIESK